MASPDSQRQLQAQINSANPGDTIWVVPGLYALSKPLLINKSLHLTSKGEAVFVAAQPTSLVVISADDVSLHGLIFQEVPRSYTADLAAVLVDGAANVSISHCTLRNTFFGIYLKNSSCVEVSHNFIQGNAQSEHEGANAIHAWKCRELKIHHNQTQGHRDGIYLEFVDHSFIYNNHNHHNLRYGLHFMFSNYCSYTANTFESNGAGVAVMFSSHVDMQFNHFNENWGMAAYGLLLKEIKDGRIAYNTFSLNTVGIYAEGALRLWVANNTFSRNGWALSLRGSSMENTFSQNNFIGNSFDLATEATRNNNLYEHNYWDNYQGYDLDNNGMGDVPHHPVGLYAYLVQKVPEGIALLRSPLVNVLHTTEQLLPLLSPVALLDNQPSMHPHDPVSSPL